MVGNTPSNRGHTARNRCSEDRRFARSRTAGLLLSVPRNRQVQAKGWKQVPARAFARQVTQQQIKTLLLNAVAAPVPGGRFRHAQTRGCCSENDAMEPRRAAKSAARLRMQTGSAGASTRFCVAQEHQRLCQHNNKGAYAHDLNLVARISRERMGPMPQRSTAQSHLVCQRWQKSGERVDKVARVSMAGTQRERKSRTSKFCQKQWSSALCDLRRNAEWRNTATFFWRARSVAKPSRSLQDMSTCFGLDNPASPPIPSFQPT